MSLRPYSGSLRITRSRPFSVVVCVALVSSFVCCAGPTVLLIDTGASKIGTDRQWMATDSQRVPDARQTSLASDASDGVMTDEKKLGIHSAHTRALAAVLVVVGIAVAGLLLVSLVVLLGHRERRIARAALPKQSQIDAFWYLRPKRSRERNLEEPVDAGAGDSVPGDENSDE